MSQFLSEITQQTQNPIWPFFDKICSIPHPSKHEQALADHIVAWAKEQGLDVKEDAVGNLFIKKPATPGMENKKGVVLQAHIDMVPQKNEDTIHDFTTDPILPYIDGEWVTATGTTLGADNGIGMASCLAVLASNDIAHGPIEVLLTIDEEAGMTGAFGLQQGWLEGDILLNTDSEQEGEVYMGCAGGIDSSLEFAIEREDAPQGSTTKKLILKGLKGGHSGCDIHTGRGNANKLLARFLAGHAEELELRLIDFTGGSLRNAIPREGSVTLALPQENVAKLEELYVAYTEMLKAELGAVETNLVTFVEDAQTQFGVFSTQSQQSLVAALNACPNGVIRMSDAIEGVVETSLNLGVITTEQDKVTALCLIRSLIDSGRSQVESMLTSVATLSGAKIAFSGAYPGWKPDADSEIMAIFRDMYQEVYGHKPNIMVIHAGLECGLFKKPYPNMDMVSFGPTIKFPHSPDEKVKIDTVDLFWEQMVNLLKHIPEKA
ncbi:cytosol nonspecific dipeptidase [Vibrio breoganii]|uniref:aminoacyl-histidine dipeptidase n=1 Tax=Vibrio breoganii TaxID=553239 RepID=UPI000C843AD2|nr:aminoacyl-histidine dipeptidase [Vibrio breoganii]PMK53421.1 cytosol nonspecific dipeptidase [Vibrio breoganii]PMK65534.1 cytosol nonspecific dipeptidase [Vibrio breoganii]PMO93003.1 cytosol nonspecific dipeptidase [Vibrio breoganii]